MCSVATRIVQGSKRRNIHENLCIRGMRWDADDCPVADKDSESLREMALPPTPLLGSIFFFFIFRLTDKFVCTSQIVFYSIFKKKLL